VRLVRAEALPDERRSVLERALGIDHRGLRVVLHDHVLGGVEGRAAAGGDHHGHRVADVLDLTALDRPVLGRPHLHVRRRPGHRQRRLEVGGQVLARVDGDDAVALLGRRGVDRPDRRVRLRRPHDRRVQHPGQLDVLGVVAPPGDHAGVFLALERLADGGHAGTPLPAAALTASTMLW
jgi:hypothetical protein